MTRAALMTTRARVLFRRPVSAPFQKTRASAEGGVRKAISTSHCRKNFAALDSLPANRAGGTGRDIQANMERLF